VSIALALIFGLVVGGVFGALVGAVAVIVVTADADAISPPDCVVYENAVVWPLPPVLKPTLTMAPPGKVAQ
jgi:hypothetical protein